jgi:hypothetical protein
MAVARAVRYGTHSRWTTEYAALSEAVQLVGHHGDLTACRVGEAEVQLT